MTSTPTARYTGVTPQELSQQWGVSQDAVKKWIADGDLKHHSRQFAVTTAQVQQFADSVRGRALLREARES